MTFSDAVTAAISAHGSWKTHLSIAIGSGESTVPVVEARRDDACPFGRWLHGEPALAQRPQFAGVKALHARFHQEAAHVLAIALDGRQDAARAAMASGSPFDTASGELVKALVAWRAAG